MKTITTIIFSLFFLSSYANIDTTKAALKDGKSIIIPSGAIAIAPIEVNINGDSCFSLTWNINTVNRDTTIDCILSLSLLDKVGNLIFNTLINIPSSILKQTNYRALIDNFIFTKNKRFIRK